VSAGYAHCGCRDCFEIVVSDDVTEFDLCAECEDAGCTHAGEREQECRRDDAYGDGEVSP
jgi:hypothetical protein